SVPNSCFGFIAFPLPAVVPASPQTKCALRQSSPSSAIRRQRLLRAARWNAAPSIHASRPIGYVAADLAAFDAACRALAIREGCCLHAHRGLGGAGHVLRIELSTAAQRHCRRDEQHLDPSLHTSSGTRGICPPIRRCPRREICRTAQGFRRTTRTERRSRQAVSLGGRTSTLRRLTAS